MRMFAKLVPWVLPAAALTAERASAHPGHGGADSTTVAHWLLELPHAAWVALAVACCAGAVLRLARRQG